MSLKYNGIGFVSNFLLRIRRRLPFSPSGMQDVAQARIAVIPPADHGSFGDEALVLGCRSFLNRSQTGIHLISSGASAPWRRLGIDFCTDLEKLSLIGGALASRRAIGRLVPEAKVVILGADSVDGAYGLRALSLRVSILNEATSLGKECVLANFSLREKPNRWAIRILRTLHPSVVLCARDRASQERAERFLRRPVLVSPDIAVHLLPDTSDSMELAQSRAVSPQEARRPLIGIVVNAHLEHLYGHGQGAISDSFYKLAESLLDAGLSVLFVAHDVRAQPGDPEMMARISAKFSGSELTANQVDRVKFFYPISAGRAKGVIAMVDLLVSARMHAAVAALSSGVPCLGLDYVDKFRGQFEWYGAAESVMPWEALFDPVAITSKVDSMLSGKKASDHLLEKSDELRSKPPRWFQSE